MGLRKESPKHNKIVQIPVFLSLKDILDLETRISEVVLADNHAHINFFDNWFEVLQRFIEKGGVRVVDVACNPREFEKSSQIFEEFSDIVRISFGLHPEYLRPPLSGYLIESMQGTLADLVLRLGKALLSGVLDRALVSELADLWISILNDKKDKISSVGEIGLDIYEVTGPDIQKAVLEAQEVLLRAHLRFAEQYQLPVVIHVRGEDKQDFGIYLRADSIISDYNIDFIYYHSFVGDVKILKTLLRENTYFGINGIATYKSASHLVKVIEALPLDKILIETDSPFLVPAKFKRRQLLDPNKNEPQSVEVIKDYILQIKHREAEN